MTKPTMTMTSPDDGGDDDQSMIMTHFCGDDQSDEVDNDGDGDMMMSWRILKSEHDF